MAKSRCLFIVFVAVLLVVFCSTCGSKSGDVKSDMTGETAKGLKIEEASEIGGYYIKRGDAFYPLAQGRFVNGHFYAHNIEACEPIVSTDQTLPMLNESDELVLFSDVSVNNVVICDTYYHGYTIPVGLEYDWDSFGSSQLFTMLYQFEEYYDVVLEELPAQTRECVQTFFDETKQFNCQPAGSLVDGFEIYGDFTYNEAFEYYYEYNEGLETETSRILFDVAYGSDITMGYYIGSVWNEISLPAYLDFWVSDSEIVVKPDTTRLGYYVIDVATLEQGTHYIATFSDSSLGASYYDTALLFEISESNGGENKDNHDKPVNNTDELISVVGLDKESAQESGGVYILMENGNYYPIQRAAKTANGYDDDVNFVMTSIYSEDIPTLQPGEKIVVFSDSEVEEGDIIAFPVEKSGYTIPLDFEAYPNYYYEEQWVTAFDFNGLLVVDELLDSQVTRLYRAGFPESGRCEIEIESGGFVEFFEARVIDSHSFCSQPTDSSFGVGCWNRGIMFADLEKEEEVTISFYHGTQYVEHTLTADLHYFGYDGCEKRDGYTGEYLSVNLTKEGYVELDTSELQTGYNVMRWPNALFVDYYIIDVK